MLASTHALKLHAALPTNIGARTSVPVLSLVLDITARNDTTESRLLRWQGRGAVLRDLDLVWQEGIVTERVAPRDLLTLALMRPTMHVDILVPLADNDGRPFPHTAFHTFEHFLATLCGGYTRRGDVEGAWQSPETGTVMRDRSRSYVVTLPAEEADEQIDKIEVFIRRHFRQEAAFLELIPTRATAF